MLLLHFLPLSFSFPFPFSFSFTFSRLGLDQSVMCSRRVRHAGVGVGGGVSGGRMDERRRMRVGSLQQLRIVNELRRHVRLVGRRRCGHLAAHLQMRCRRVNGRAVAVVVPHLSWRRLQTRRRFLSALSSCKSWRMLLLLLLLLLLKQVMMLHLLLMPLLLLLLL